jgi:hypothetical protein
LPEIADVDAAQLDLLAADRDGLGKRNEMQEIVHLKKVP